MRKFKKYNILLLFTSLILIYISCSEDNPTESKQKEVLFSFEQISGCNSSLGKMNSSDSSFNYLFGDTLKIDFGIWGNCCPDSQRFMSDYQIKSDTIFIAVEDTAVNGCYCNCNYTIHIELQGLTENEYLFFFDYPGKYDWMDSLSYREIIKK